MSPVEARCECEQAGCENAAPAAQFITSNLGFLKKNIWLSLCVISHFSAELKRLNPLKVKLENNQPTV